MPCLQEQRGLAPDEGSAFLLSKGSCEAAKSAQRGFANGAGELLLFSSSPAIASPGCPACRSKGGWLLRTSTQKQQGSPCRFAITASSSGMGGFVGFIHPGLIQISVHLGSGHIRMAQHPLNRIDISAIGQQVRCERMSQHVGRQFV